MRIRHRVPVLFTLSMMDVFCCALGCVILLWLWNERMAKQKAKAAGDTRYQLEETLGYLAGARKSIGGLTDDLAAARRRLDAQDAALTDARKTIDTLNASLTDARNQAAMVTTDRDRLRDQLATAKAHAAALTTDRDTVRADLATARKMLDDKARELKDLQAKADANAELLAKRTREFEKLSADTSDLLARKKKDEEKLTTSAAAAQKRALDLESLLRQKDDMAAAATRKSDDLTRQLHDAEALLKQLRTQAAAAASLRTEMDAQGKKLAAAEARVRDFERDLTNRKTAMLDAQGKLEEIKGDNKSLAEQNKSLTEQMTRLRLTVDNRFAGVQLTGHRVILVVDMSGSMKLSEERVPAPDKWPAVAETASRILKSLTGVEKFQVIVFSDKIDFPLGAAGDWLDFEDATSPDRVRRALANVAPQGGTNMYLPLDAAFNYRAKGLDTIYLISDGLPNEGPGLTNADQARVLNDQQRSEILGRHIRLTLKNRWNKFEPGKPQVRVNSIGFFYESPDVGAFLWALARENDGGFVGMSKP